MKHTTLAIIMFVMALLTAGMAIADGEKCYNDYYNYGPASAYAEICMRWQFADASKLTANDYIEFECIQGDLYLNINPDDCTEFGCPGENYGSEVRKYYLTSRPTRVSGVCWHRDDIYTPINNDHYYAWVYATVFWDNLIYADTPQPPPPNCGNGVCDTAQGETKQNCPEDCGYSPDICGDGVCGGSENANNCYEDCYIPPGNDRLTGIVIIMVLIAVMVGVTIWMSIKNK